MLRFKSRAATVIALTTLLALPSYAVNRDAQKRDFDSRVALNSALNVAPLAAQQAALDALRATIPSLRVNINHATGVTRTLSNDVGYLSGPQAGEHEAVALAFVNANATALGLSAADLADYEIESKVFSAVSGATHLYMRQRAAGLSLYNGQLHINVNRDGRIISVNNKFLPGLASAINTTVPALSAAAAVAAAANHLGTAPGTVSVDQPAAGVDQHTLLTAPSVSKEQIEARLMLMPVAAGNARLVWNFMVFTHDDQHIYQFNVDAVDATVWTRFDAVDSASYTVYPQPVESPQHTSPLPPADGRIIATDPADALASPFGWHDSNGVPGAEFTIMSGNNVEAYEDRNSSNNPPASQPDCGGTLDCNFAIDLTVDPINHIPASVANLFYWNNIIHDIQYQYGFDEAAGNFQRNNYGRGGDFAQDADFVEAEAQDDANDNSDAGGNCNANFGTLPDGFTGRMQMYTCDLVSPERDGDLDNGVIVHEYGHGISNRLVGGPLNTFCLEGDQQPGEGLSDWWALAYTAEASHTGPMARGIGTYLFGQAPDGPGIRPFPYSTDNNVNPDTYESIGSRVAPHGVGSVWAQAAWEVYWALVDEHGFSTDLYDAAGGFGNQRAMLYVNEGLKNTICQPTFADVRDGIIQAATDNNNGEDVCLIWQAFADFGLGADAIPGTPGTTVVVNGFSPPRECQADFTLEVMPTELSVCAPLEANYTVSLGANLPAVPAPVTLSLAGTPPGSVETFMPNPVAAPATSTLSISSASATPGVYDM
ncbi:MAG: M36 family metallopeptidase, partial [Gammaproteobacteria bacterium]|nr:M36 family metallopeptidase [Gammaproteobacteria bacterium]